MFGTPAQVYRKAVKLQSDYIFEARLDTSAASHPLACWTMASSVVQLFGFLVAVGGLAATIAATCMAEWSTHESGNGRHEFYEGLWGECSVSGSTRMTCDAHESLMDVPWKVQVTRAVLISSMFLSSLAVLVSIGGMKCTRFMDDRDESKRCMTLVGGVTFIIAGLLAMVGTSWYAGILIEEYKHSRELERSVFGSAVFVSWVGSILSMVGGAFLTCRKCSGMRSSMSPTMLRQTTTLGTEYV
ncbi:Claudin-1 [Merluccius polli]|uniref:Claudin n=1 Tax=Merluccius polli TaxID=89951 RepID=A0AA47NYA7_MERPO|nr:Claudin-1 [Merluccius polli]